MKKFYVFNRITWTVQKLTIPEILKLINDGRSKDWTPYTAKDWREGLEHWTEYRLVKPFNVKGPA